MINKETIISVFDDRMTLLQFLKSVQKALHDSVLTSIEMVNTDETHAKLILHFEDGSTKETEAIELPTGFKVIQDDNVDDWTAYVNAHVGDLVIAWGGFVGLITKLERQTFEQVGEHISHIEITGLESNMLPTKYIGTFNGVTDTWTHEELQISGGTKLYKHAITFNNGSYTQTLNVIALEGQQATSPSELAQLTILFSPALSDVVKIENTGQYYSFSIYQNQGNAIVPVTTNIVNFINDEVTPL